MDLNLVGFAVWRGRMLVAWAGVLTGVVGAVCLFALIILLLFLLRGRHKEPPSPDYQAVGNVKPQHTFTFESASSLRKHLSEVTSLLIRHLVTSSSYISSVCRSSIGFSHARKCHQCPHLHLLMTSASPQLLRHRYLRAAVATDAAVFVANRSHLPSSQCRLRRPWAPFPVATRVECARSVIWAILASTAPTSMSLPWAVRVGIQNVKSKILQVSKMSRVNLQKCQISYWLSWYFSADIYKLMSNFKLREHNLKA